MQIAMSKDEADATLHAICIRCDDIKRIVAEATNKKRPDAIDMDQITLLTTQYNSLQKVMVNLITSGACLPI